MLRVNANWNFINYARNRSVDRLIRVRIWERGGEHTPNPLPPTPNPLPPPLPADQA